MTEADESRGTARSNGASPVVNLAALEPLYQTFEEPCRYRAPGEGKGDPAQIISGRRPSYIPIAQNLRRFGLCEPPTIPSCIRFFKSHLPDLL